MVETLLIMLIYMVLMVIGLLILGFVSFFIVPIGLAVITILRLIGYALI